MFRYSVYIIYFVHPVTADVRAVNTEKIIQFSGLTLPLQGTQ